MITTHYNYSTKGFSHFITRNYSTIWSMKSAAVMTVEEAFAFLIFFHLCAW